MARLPDGEPVPSDGALPPWLADVPPAAAGLGLYLHVPFCRVRCGYCDFTTYTAAELGGGGDQARYAQTAAREVALAAGVLGAVGRARPVTSVFFGGGTPTLLPPGGLAVLLGAVRDELGVEPDAEVTTEANPDSVGAADLEALAEAGFTRVSFGMQSAVTHVLGVLDRTHDPARVPEVVRWARDAGLAVSLDLIYGTPGESVDDWRTSVEAALETGVDHVSAYALVIEEGTRMGALVRRGVLAAPDPDDQAAKYELADDLLTAAGLDWYEVSNWARPGAACRHNEAYWRGADWWGVGPGAHSHVGGPDASVRWWNVKHPRPYAEALADGRTPAAGREVLGADEVALERVLLGVRMSGGLALDELSAAGRHAVAGLVADGLLEGVAAVRGRAVLTRRGRLLADAVVRSLTD
ncbi:radical SAM family heme chaperone HemW [Actinotalea sp. M2MS4P-6]|uniref:radical SAM family heme chaperone HemW n=1 Tax=Actinotalea sp. M2MS4P-6 TaxID=2983762 RepID=UPI0021E3CFB4|nr:radical SAM family heme chaperone HemW [Actinotalea sp. M2MS4P-6]MCV2393938.1 radical SAM family heme chaperone HemW [Actinotalea sp. M2MS4P-6]